jgi:hypothetical protein
MALVTPAVDLSIDTSTAMYADQITGLYAGEDLLACAPCYIKAADDKVYQANGTAATEPATSYAGFTPRAVKAGQPCTLFGTGTRFRYVTVANALTIGGRLYIGATAGRLDTAASVGDAVGVARAITITDIVVTRES